MPKQKRKGLTSPILIIASVLIAFTFLGIIYLNNKSKFPQQLPSPSPSPLDSNNQKLKTFNSETMNFNVDIPANFETEEKGTRVTIFDLEGEILINRSGTNFDNLEDYLNDLDNKNKIQVLEEKKLQINRYNAKERLVKFPGGTEKGERVYTIFTDHWIYSLSTSSPSLYDELDQIAQSFRYTP